MVMTSQVYQDHLKILKSAVARKRKPGIDSNALTSLGAMDQLCELETVFRYGSVREGVLLDILTPGAFEGSFHRLLEKQVFEEYLEHKHAALEMTMDEFLDRKEYLRFRVENKEEYSDSSDVDESEFLEPEDDSRLLESTGFSDEEISNQLGSYKASIFTIPLGVDEDGFDIWTIEDLDVEGLEDTAPESALDEFDFSSLDTEDKTSNGLPSEHFGTDDDGFDLWYDPDAVVEVPELEPDNLLSEHFGVDEDGFDVWHESKPESFNIESAEESDGWDHTQDEDRKGLGELLSSWQGTDEDGFDIWVDPGAAEPSVQDVLTEDGTLGILHSTPYGVDANGFDIWTPPVATTEVSSSGPVIASSGTVPADAGTRVSHNHFRPAVNSSVEKSSEDQTAELLYKSADRLRKMGKRFGKFMIS